MLPSCGNRLLSCSAFDMEGWHYEKKEKKINVKTAVSLLKRMRNIFIDVDTYRDLE